MGNAMAIYEIRQGLLKYENRRDIPIWVLSMKSAESSLFCSFVYDYVILKLNIVNEQKMSQFHVIRPSSTPSMYDLR